MRDAGFALSIILLIILLILLVICPRARYTYNTASDRISKLALVTDIGATAIATLVSLVVTGLGESFTSVSRYGYVTYILEDAFGRIADIAEVIFISRLILAKTASDQAPRILHIWVKTISIIAVGLITALEVVCFGLSTAFDSQLIESGGYLVGTSSEQDAQAENKVSFALSIIYLLFVTFLLIVLSYRVSVNAERKVCLIRRHHDCFHHC